ncbi:MAG: magnesium chelatase [Nitrospirae bacterium]|nr:magnesium chelatase [Nitrospirota bacterium]
MNKPKTVGELRASGTRLLTVKQELRKNLLHRLKNKEELFPKIVGYEETVTPAIENAILAGHDVIFLGERGQAKSRIIRHVVELLDEAIPAIEGCEIHDHPFAPICYGCRERAAKEGDALPIRWVGREERFGEKLSTPDVTVADLIGEIDPIKVAEGRYLADERAIHYGLIPRSNRGIFAINELPDLSERVQVGLFNLLEERDVQIKGFRVRLPLDVFIMASANPEDYTSRGRIITPLKDRFQAQIRTHYPKTRDIEIKIMEQESSCPAGNGVYKIEVPAFMKEIVCEVTFQGRKSAEINQRSGVSVRLSITNMETLVANAEKRAIRNGEDVVVPRITDLDAVRKSTEGKVEMEYSGDEKVEGEVVDKLLRRAIKEVFHKYFRVEELQSVVDAFASGQMLYVSDRLPSADYIKGVSGIPDLMRCLSPLDLKESPPWIASGTEFLLEGLYLNQKLFKQSVDHTFQYKGIK